jgi:uncharacterized alkaline shock family protein YloU
VSTALPQAAAETESAPAGKHSATGEDAAALQDGAVELPEAGDRGRLTIAESVVERVAGYAVTQVEGASAAPRRMLGINVGSARADTEASVSAKVEGRVATVSATVAIIWPHPVRTVAEQLRHRIREDVRRMTDVEVAQIDLDVVSFAAGSAPPRRVR